MIRTWMARAALSPSVACWCVGIEQLSVLDRPMGDIAGLREVHDDVGRLTVSAFPFARRRSRVHHIPSRVRDDARPPLFLERDGRS